MPTLALYDTLYSFKDIHKLEQFIELLDTCYPNFENAEAELKKKIEMIRLNLLVFLTHDGRHLGMFANRLWFGSGEEINVIAR
jgi:hypothetical protein